MSSRAIITLRGADDIARARHWLAMAPLGTRIEFSASKRSLDQNRLMWAMLTEVSLQLEWHGKRLKPWDWKLVFLDGLKRESRLVPNLDGDGFVNLRQSSSVLTRQEMSELIELITAFGAQHGVTFKDYWGEPAA